MTDENRKSWAKITCEHLSLREHESLKDERKWYVHSPATLLGTLAQLLNNANIL